MMEWRLFFLLHLIYISQAFKFQSLKSFFNLKSLQILPLFSTSGPVLDIHTKGIELNAPLRTHINSKLLKAVKKLGKDAISAHVLIKVLKYPESESHTHISKTNANIAEITVRFKGGHVVHACEKSDHIFSSIDLASHRLAHLLRKHQELRVDRSRKLKIGRLLKDRAADDADGVQPVPKEVDIEEDFVELNKQYTEKNIEANLQVVREKLFSFPPTSVEDAVLALELIDHPFYLFRDKVSNEINLVYKREGGGVGLIGPAGAGVRQQ